MGAAPPAAGFLAAGFLAAVVATSLVTMPTRPARSVAGTFATLKLPSERVRTAMTLSRWMLTRAPGFKSSAVAGWDSLTRRMRPLSVRSAGTPR